MDLSLNSEPYSQDEMDNLLGANPLVIYKFNSADLQDYFELVSDDEAHVALEGVLNIIFGKQEKSMMDEILESGSISTPTIDEVCSEIGDHEVQVANETISMMLHMHDQAQKRFGMDVIEYDDITQHPSYSQYEHTFNQILIKLCEDIHENKYNQDVITLTNEMAFHNRIELYSYRYNTNTNVLHVTIRTA